VVVGVDGSDTSLRAAAYAVGVCRRQGSRLVVVYAREPGGGLAQLMDTTGSSSAAALRLQDDVERMLRQSQTLAEAEGIRSELRVRTGEPYQVLSAVGARGAGGLRRRGVVGEHRPHDRGVARRAAGAQRAVAGHGRALSPRADDAGRPLRPTPRAAAPTPTPPRCPA
jgi:nucleotide-binding universal stress UspA family protein